MTNRHTFHVSLACLALVFSPGLFAQQSVKPLTGSEVLDIDGQILRRQLEGQAGPQASARGVAPIAPAQGFATPMQQPAFEPRVPKNVTLSVLGVDATAIGGPVVMHADIRWRGQTIPVEVGSRVDGYRVTRIVTSGTTLVGPHHKTIMLPRLDPWALETEDKEQAAGAAPARASAMAPIPAQAQPQPATSQLAMPQPATPAQDTASNGIAVRPGPQMPANPQPQTPPGLPAVNGQATAAAR